MQVEEIKCKTALNPLKSKFLPFDWDLNIYRGCSHSCVYCFARYTHEYLGHTGAKDFDKIIKVKINIPEVLEKQLNKMKRKGGGALHRPVPSGTGHRMVQGVISIGGISDLYQPLEKKYQLTRKCLEVIANKGCDISICTKSSLILRDLDLLKKINKNNFCAIAFTITTLDQKIADKIEPFASKVKDRIVAMREIKKSGIPVGLHLMPVMPGLTDREKDLRKLLKLAKGIGVNYVIYGNLGVRACVKKILFPFIQEEFPELSGLYRRLYGYPAPFGAGRRPRDSKVRQELNQRREFLKNLVGEYKFPSLKFPGTMRRRAQPRTRNDEKNKKTPQLRLRF